MIVVADTTPLHYLVVIEREHLLPALYGRVLIPPAVADELNHESTPQVVRDWLASRPSWLEIRQPAHTLGSNVDLDWGEQEPSLPCHECRWEKSPVPESRTPGQYMKRRKPGKRG